MPPKGSHIKALVEAVPDGPPGGPDPAGKTAPSKQSNGVNNLPSEAEVTAGGSGLSIEDKLKALATVAADDDFIEDDSDEELKIDMAKSSYPHLRFTVILIFLVIPSPEVAFVILTMRTLMKRVWSNILTDDVLSSVKFQELLPTFVMKTRYSRLQVSFMHKADAVNIKQTMVDHKLSNGSTIHCFWLHQEDAIYVRKKASSPQLLEVYFKNIHGDIPSELVKEVMVTHSLKVRKQSAFAEGHCFHRVLHPVTGADTDKIKGLVAKHTSDKHLTPLLLDAAFVQISTGSNREEWLCTLNSCGKTHGKSFMSAADHITSASHLLGLEKLGATTLSSLEKLNLHLIRKDYKI
ncbi:unnamed protein product [Closterium sp. NIES-65]|nr:unnamed protein product [Closterium sp. NIES-65]